MISDFFASSLFLTRPDAKRKIAETCAKAPTAYELSQQPARHYLHEPIPEQPPSLAAAFPNIRPPEVHKQTPPPPPAVPYSAQARTRAAIVVNKQVCVWVLTDEEHIV
jgi:hypothetical protein